MGLVSHASMFIRRWLITLPSPSPSATSASRISIASTQSSQKCSTNHSSHCSWPSPLHAVSPHLPPRFAGVVAIPSPRPQIPQAAVTRTRMHIAATPLPPPATRLLALPTAYYSRVLAYSLAQAVRTSDSSAARHGSLPFSIRKMSCRLTH